ncbi:MAG: 30S ribosomal protein S8 [Gammaproteobacteria bacterium]|nr:30S ribosomal protein S8 [Gammaproteobacteria bacterium]
MMTDPIADMFTRIRNAHKAEKASVLVPASKTKKAVLQVLKDEGFIIDFKDAELLGKPALSIDLKYFEGRPVIAELKRVSTPGRRLYSGRHDMPKVSGGLGIAIVSTSKGIMTDRSAREAGVGGEILCYVS